MPGAPPSFSAKVWAMTWNHGLAVRACNDRDDGADWYKAILVGPEGQEVQLFQARLIENLNSDIESYLDNYETKAEEKERDAKQSLGSKIMDVLRR
ncbi:hypothetical protein ABZX51_008407 [Aspergillus tubingensis]